MQVTKSKEQINKESNKGGKNTLHITNLAYETSEKELEDYLVSFYGLEKSEILKTLLVKDRNTGRSKGYGYLELSSRSLVKKCLEQKEPPMLGKRNLVIRDAQKKFEHSKHANEKEKEKEKPRKRDIKRE